jgi:TPR repeat protein
MFGRLANPNGPNNALSQVLYGLALRHGWGCAQNEATAIRYLSLAASNSADIETEALSSGMKKGGAAKGELTLAMFELANCFRQGWGVKKDPVAAKQYYEAAANIGDLDAMNEIAWCYTEGFGCKKDKVRRNHFPAFCYSRPLLWTGLAASVFWRGCILNMN